VTFHMSSRTVRLLIVASIALLASGLIEYRLGASPPVLSARGHSKYAVLQHRIVGAIANGNVGDEGFAGV